MVSMSDNANKMGTDMGLIQNAYNGFAKQNYTMLDNLKLGYGGTQEEMKRLIDDASKMTGIQEKLNVTVEAGDMSFANIANAIMVVQEQMGIAGTTALEAATTIEGSTKMMKASWENLLTGLADENANIPKLIDDFIASVGTAWNNIEPRVLQIFEGISKMVKVMLPRIAKEVPPILQAVLPDLIDAAAGMVKALFEGLIGILPSVTNTLLDLVLQIGDILIELFPELAKCGIELITQLALGIAEALPDLIPEIVNVALMITETLLDNVDLLVECAIQLIRRVHADEGRQKDKQAELQ